MILSEVSFSDYCKNSVTRTLLNSFLLFLLFFTKVDKFSDSPKLSSLTFFHLFLPTKNTSALKIAGGIKASAWYMRLRLSSIKLCLGEATLLCYGNKVKLGAVHNWCNIGKGAGRGAAFYIWKSRPKSRSCKQSQNQHMAMRSINSSANDAFGRDDWVIQELMIWCLALALSLIWCRCF